MPFVKGQSGNPSGRPKTSEEEKAIRKLAREGLLEIVPKLIEQARDSDNAFFLVKAAELLAGLGNVPLVKAAPVVTIASDGTANSDDDGELTADEIRSELSN